MSDEVGCGAASSAVADLSSALTELSDVNFDRLSRAEFLLLMQQRERLRRRDDYLDSLLISHATKRGFAAELNEPNTKTMLVNLLGITPGNAHRRIATATDLAPRQSLTGQDLPPVFPVLAAACRDGAVSTDHATVITGMIKKLPDAVRDEHADAAETTLTAAAHTLHPAQLATLATRLAAHLNPDGIAPSDAERTRRRDVSITDNADGSGTVKGTLTATCLAALRAALDALAAPRPADPADPSGPGRDIRTPGQRYHDALEDAMLRLLTDGGLPDTGGAPTTILLTMTWTDFVSRTGYANTGHGNLVSVAEALRLAADAELIPVIFTDTGGILSYGRARRTATAAQRRALAARDKGCSFPGCDRPPAWCQTHHQPEYVLGGTTSIDQMTLLCGHHHRNFAATGWQCHMINGKPHWIPPTWIDPQQRPRQNQAHT